MAKGTIVVAVASVLLTAVGCTSSVDRATEPLTPGPCPEVVVEALSDVVRGQATALGEGDWEKAYTYASPSFRSAITVDQFVTIVLADYGMLTTFQGATFGQCDAVAENAALFQVVIDSDAYQPVTMVYQMVLDEDQWWVSGVEFPQSAIPNA